MEERVEELKPYIVIYTNYMVNEVQDFKVMAKNEFRAGRLFYLMHGRNKKGTIESISEVRGYWTEESIREHLKKKKKEREAERERRTREFNQSSGISRSS